MSIPHLLHQMWLDKSTDTNPGPPEKYNTDDYALSMQRLNCPPFEYRFWNMERVKKLFETQPELAVWRDFYFTKLTRHIEKCDFARYAIMFIQGGLYLDLDFTCLRSLVDLVGQHSELMLTPDVSNPNDMLDAIARPRPLVLSELIEGGRKEGGTPPRLSIFNGVFASVPRHAFWSGLMNFIMWRYSPETGVLWTTGPGALGIYAEKMGFHPAQKPSWYEPNHLFFAGLGKHRQHIEGTQSASNGQELAYTSTKWLDGTGWSMNSKEIGTQVLEFGRQRNVIWWTCLAFLILAVALGAGLIFACVSKTKEKKRCQERLTQPHQGREQCFATVWNVT